MRLKKKKNADIVASTTTLALGKKMSSNISICNLGARMLAARDIGKGRPIAVLVQQQYRDLMRVVRPELYLGVPPRFWTKAGKEGCRPIRYGQQHSLLLLYSGTLIFGQKSTGNSRFWLYCPITNYNFNDSSIHPNCYTIFSAAIVKAPLPMTARSVIVFAQVRSA